MFKKNCPSQENTEYLFLVSPLFFQQRTISKLTMRDQFIIFFDSIFVSDKTIKLK